MPTKDKLRWTRTLQTRHFYPLLGFLLPTLVIGFGVVIPRSCIAGVNELTIGFGMALLGAAIAYWQGIRAALRTETPRSEDQYEAT